MARWWSSATRTISSRDSNTKRTRIDSWSTSRNDWECLDWNYIQIRRAGSNSAGSPKKTGGIEEKASPRRSTSDRNRFNAEFNYLDFRSPNGIQTQGVLTTGAGIGNNADTNVFDRTLKSGLTTVVGATAVNELRFGMFKDRQYDPASPSLLPVTGPASY